MVLMPVARALERSLLTSPSIGFCILAVCVLAFLSAAAEEPAFAPDTLVMRNGENIRGLILKYGTQSVTIKQSSGERKVPLKDILRIHDEVRSGAYFADVNRRGSLPSWQALVNDLRTHDSIKRLERIPATVVKEGEFKNVPYMAFRLNQNLEMNIYGDPDDPVALEMGIYGAGAREQGLQKTWRTFLAGFLATRAEISALYDLSLKGGRKDAGAMTVEVKAPADAGAHGAWWIRLYNRSALSASRLSDAEYARLTRPAASVAPAGSHRGMIKRKDADVFLNGFYRDKDGVFRLGESP